MSRSLRDVRWLCEALTDLFDLARSAPEPDHQACAKYADLLFRLLQSRPAQDARDDASALLEIREKAQFLLREQKSSAATQPPSSS